MVSMFIKRRDKSLSKVASGLIIADYAFARLRTFPNIFITGDQAFVTREALENITAIENIMRF
jgi:D-lactate dehydrogenase